MKIFRSITLVVALALGSGALLAAPAHAAPQTLFGTTVDTVAQPSGESVLGDTAHVLSIGSSVDSTLGAARGLDVVVTLRENGTDLVACTIPAGGLSCSLFTGDLLAPGAHDVTMRFTMGAETVDVAGEFFSVASDSPTVGIEWRDASGAWIDGNGVGLPLRGDTALRCVVTNNSNAPIEFATLAASTPAGSVPISGTLEAGETGYYEVWTGDAASVTSSVACSGGVTRRDGTITGGGNGGGVISLGGTVTVTPQLAPGVTATLVGDSITPPVSPTYAVLLDGADVAGSPITPGPSPKFAFSLEISIPDSLAPGTHAVSLVASSSGRDVVIAYFPFDVPEVPVEAELAATGAVGEGALALGALALLGGGLLLVAEAHRRRSARAA